MLPTEAFKHSVVAQKKKQNANSEMNTTERNASTTKADSNAKATGDLKEAVRKEYAAQIQAASKAVSSNEATHDQDSDGASDNSVTMLEPLRGDKGHQAALHREALQRIYQKALKHIVEKSKLPLPSCFTSENPDINTNRLPSRLNQYLFKVIACASVSMITGGTTNRQMDTWTVKKHGSLSKTGLRVSSSKSSLTTKEMNKSIAHAAWWLPGALAGSNMDDQGTRTMTTS